MTLEESQKVHEGDLVRVIDSGPNYGKLAVVTRKRLYTAEVKIKGVGPITLLFKNLELVSFASNQNVMTGRDLILYILNNHKESEPVFKDGCFLGFLTIQEFAEKHRVGEETVRLWVNYGYVKAVIIYDEVYIPCDAEVQITDPKQEG